MKMYITAMSRERKQIKEEIFNAVRPITDHITKLYLFPDTEYVDHWRKEVWSFLNETHKLKSSGKWPKAGWMYELLAGDLDMVDTHMYLIMDEYAELTPKRFDAVELAEMLDSYFSWISSELAENGAVRSAQVRQKLVELGL